MKINLKWNTYDDLDLHVFDPDGFEIYYGKKQHQCQEVLGQLDIDANAGSSHTRTPQENIFWEDGKNAPVGHYRVSVVYFSKKDTFNSVPFTVTVYPGKGETKVFTGIVYNAKDRREIIEFDYSEKAYRTRNKKTLNPQLIFFNGLLACTRILVTEFANRGRVKAPNIKKLVVRSCVDVQRVFVFLRKRAL